MYNNNYDGTFNTNYCRFAVLFFRIIISVTFHCGCPGSIPDQ